MPHSAIIHGTAMALLHCTGMALLQGCRQPHNAANFAIPCRQCMALLFSGLLLVPPSDRALLYMIYARGASTPPAVSAAAPAASQCRASMLLGQACGA